MSPLLSYLRGLLMAAALVAGLTPAIAHAPMPASPCHGHMIGSAQHHAETGGGNAAVAVAGAHDRHDWPSGDPPGHHQGCCAGLCLCALSAMMPPALPAFLAASPVAPVMQPVAGIRGLDRRPELPPPRRSA